MAKKTYLHRGLVTKVEESFAKVAKLFDLERWWKETAVKHSVPFNDKCNEQCPSPSGQPVQVVDLGEGGIEIQRHDGEEWREVTSSQLGISGFTGTINAVEGTYMFENGLLSSFTPTP